MVDFKHSQVKDATASAIRASQSFECPSSYSLALFSSLLLHPVGVPLYPASFYGVTLGTVRPVPFFAQDHATLRLNDVFDCSSRYLCAPCGLVLAAYFRKVVDVERCFHGFVGWVLKLCG